MKLCRRCGLEKDESEFARQTRNRSGLQSACKACHSEMGKAWYARNKELRCQKAAAWRKEHAEHVYEVAKKWRAANPELHTAILKAWRTRHPDRAREAWRSFDERNRERRRIEHHAHYACIAEEWRRRAKERALHAPHLGRLYAANRRARIRRQMPKWANLELIEQFYLEARQLTITTGVPHHVDHIIPLRGKLVWGLHVETNLRVITATENLRKFNKLVEEI